MKLNNIPLELDGRIYDIEDIKTVITADEKDVGKMGYFANSIHSFKNLKGLDGIKYGKLMYLSNLDYGGDKSDKCFACDNHWAYRYFIPADNVRTKEQQKEYEEWLDCINSETDEERQDKEDYLKIYFICGSFDSRGDFKHTWIKLETAEFPFSKERVQYLLKKFVLGLDDSENPRVDK